MDCSSLPWDPSREGKWPPQAPARQVQRPRAPQDALAPTFLTPTLPPPTQPPYVLSLGATRQRPSRSWRMAFCFSASPLLCAFQHLAGQGRQGSPYSRPHASRPARSRPGSRPGEAAPPRPCGWKAEGKLFLPRPLGRLWPRAHFSGRSPRAPQRAQGPQGVPLSGVPARPRSNPGVVVGGGGSGGFQSPQPAGIGALGPAGSPGSEIWSFPGLESWRLALKRTRRERTQGASSLRSAGTGRWPPTE